MGIRTDTHDLQTDICRYVSSYYRIGLLQMSEGSHYALKKTHASVHIISSQEGIAQLVSAPA